MELNIGYLYPNLLNIYGDRGNIICLKNRCQWRGINVRVFNLSLEDKIEAGKYDLFFGGGGQDRQQLIVSKDLQTKKKVLRQEAERGIPMLAICGTYQLFGHYFKTHAGEKMPGISIFDAYTVASAKRKIGNIVIKISSSLTTNNQPARSCYSVAGGQPTTKVVGFENHSGNTFIKKNSETKPFGKVIKGFGNNGQDKTEGAVFRNVLGTYLHGPVLPKNPHLADFLIEKALTLKYAKKVNLKRLDDSLEWQAHSFTLKLR